MTFYHETRGRFGKWCRNTWAPFASMREAIDASNTEIVDGFETIDSIRIVDETGRVMDAINESDL